MLQYCDGKTELLLEFKTELEGIEFNGSIHVFYDVSNLCHTFSS